MARSSAILRRLPAFAAFFLSGTSSLIFQNIWGRMLHHVFGSSSVAVSTVVTVFMGGLGLGAWLAGKWADRIRHPIITYALAEIGVGLWALLVPVLVDPEGWLATVNQFLRVQWGAGSAGFMLGRFLFVVPVLLVPTTLMGASLPLLARHFVQHDQQAGGVGARVGVLYAINTFGAVAGVFFAGFVLMPTVGVTWTNTFAISLNFALGVGIFLLRRPLLGDTWAPGQKLELWPKRKTEPELAPASEAEAETELEEEAEPEAGATRDTDLAQPVSPFARKAAFIAFAASGAAALCYEVVWTRALAMTIGASVYSFALILGTFLIGIAGGSAIGAGALAARQRMITGAAVAALGLSLFANLTFFVHADWIAWLGRTVADVLVIGVIWTAVLARSRNIQLPGAEPSPTVPVLLLLAVPAMSSGVNAMWIEGPLIPIVAAVIGTVCAFVALVVLLRRHPVLQLASIQLFIAAATFVNYLFQDEIPCAFAALVSGIDNLPEHVGTVQFFMFLTSSLCVLPATLGMGAMFPLTLRVWTSGGHGVGRDVGLVYAGNTAGSIVGAWLPGFVLLQLLGLERTLHAGMVLNLLLGLLMLIASSSSASERAQAKRRAPGDEPEGEEEPEGAPAAVPLWHAGTVYVLAPLVPALIALLYLGTASPTSALRWDLSRMTLGVFRVSLADSACSPEWGEPDLVYYNDGLSTTVSVEKWGRHYALKNNGKVDASNGDDMPTQIMVSGFPLLMRPEGVEDTDVAIVGFGSGVTVGAALQFPVDHVDVVELEKSIVDASWWFRDVNNLEYGSAPGEPGWEFPYVDMPRLKVINDDGRNYLASSPKKYDVIISEPSNPWITGVSDLFTEDHFRLTKQKLAPGGIYCQWVQLYELSPLNVKSIYRTFASQFDHVLAFSADRGSSDTILLGSDAPLPLDLSRVEKAFSDARARRELQRAEVRTPHDVFARLLFANREEVLRYARIEEHRENGRWVAHADSDNAGPCREPDCRRVPAPLNTDDNARVEFSAPKNLIGFERFRGYVGTFYDPEWTYGRVPDRLVGVGEGEHAATHYAEQAMAMMGHGRMVEAGSLIERSVAEVNVSA
ncbi:MAG: fused MFS/spermidine synthase, partial [Polyangiales bacterium]